VGVLLNVGITVIPEVYAQTTWYVAITGNDSNDCKSPGTACLTIQAAIDKASDGDTVLVASGTYNGQLKVTKNDLLVKGTGAATTIITGEGGAPGLVVICGNMNLFQGFTVDISANLAGHNHEEKGVRVTGDDNLIQGNIVKGRGDATAIYDEGDLGMLIAYIAIEGCPVNANEVADANQIASSEVTNWDNNGINIGGTDLSDGTMVMGNNIHHNYNGIYNDRATNSKISGNSIHDNNNVGIAVEARLGRPSSGTVIEYNDIFANGSGLIFPGIPVGSSRAGIVFLGVGGVTNVGNNIHDNVRADGTAKGIRVRDNSEFVGDPTTLSFNFDNIFNNDNGLVNDLPAAPGNVVNAKNNWWGAVSGPKDTSPVPDACGLTLDNPSGAGNAVSACVDYAPWLGVAIGPSTLIFSDGTNTLIVNPTTRQFALIYSGSSYRICSGDSVVVTRLNQLLLLTICREGGIITASGPTEGPIIVQLVTFNPFQRFSFSLPRLSP